MAADLVPNERSYFNACWRALLSDADSTHRRALERGANSIEEPFDTPYGDRRCMVEDPWGNTWQIAVRGATGGAG
jgi:PhnB protein